jgi:hypothetical protein
MRGGSKISAQIPAIFGLIYTILILCLVIPPYMTVYSTINDTLDDLEKAREPAKDGDLQPTVDALENFTKELVPQDPKEFTCDTILDYIRDILLQRLTHRTQKD